MKICNLNPGTKENPKNPVNKNSSVIACLTRDLSLWKCVKAQAAFTLAETLIALAVIGIVAALTIPAIVQRYKERVIVTRVKQAYSIFSQAYLMAIAEHGTFDQWGLGGREKIYNDDGSHTYDEAGIGYMNKFFEIMKPYLKVIEYTPFTQENCGLLAGDVAKEELTGMTLANGTAIRALYIQDGCSRTGYCGDFYLVTDGGLWEKNGADGKAHARKETFNFMIYKDRIIPYGIGLNISQEEFKKNCIDGDNYSKCTFWVINNDNMDYLHCNDLNVKTDTKCK